MGFFGKVYGRFLDAVALLFSGGVVLSFVVLAFVFFVTIGSIVLISNSYEVGIEQDQIARDHEQMKSVRGYISPNGQTCYRDLNDLPEWAEDLIRAEVLELPQPLSWGYVEPDEVCFGDEALERSALVKMTLHIKKEEFMKYVEGRLCEAECKWHLAKVRGQEIQKNTYHYGYEKEDLIKDGILRDLSVVPETNTIQFRLMLIQGAEISLVRRDQGYEGLQILY